MNIFERAIGLFSPKLAAERAAWNAKRTILEDNMARGYVGASRRKRNANWNPGNKSADAYLAKDGALLRARAHDLVRNNPHAANIVSKHADYIVGDGIVPRARTGKADIDTRIDELWKEFSSKIDPQGILNFDGLTRQAVRGMVAGGEMLARRRDRRLSDGLTVPLQIDLLEAEFLDSRKVLPYAQESQNRVVEGVEFDAIGRRRGYWLFPTNPSGNDPLLGYTSLTSVFVPATGVLHLFEPLRTQVRGETWLSPVIEKLRDLDEYDFAEMQRKKTEACMVGVVTSDIDDPETEDPNLGFGFERGSAAPFDENGEPIDGATPEAWPVQDLNGDPIERFEPGMFYNARPGSKIEFNTPATSAGYDTYTRTQLRSIAAGARMPYEVMTGDLSEVTFASGRMGRVDYMRFVEGIQWNVVIPMWCTPIWNWFVETIRTLGEIPESLDVKVEWTTPVFQTITPIDDVNADKEEVRSGFASWDDKVIARGYDPDEVARKIVARNAFFDQHNVILDTDPRRTAKNGQLHGQASNEKDSPDAPGEQEREEAAQRARRAAGASAKLSALPGGKAG